MNLINTEFTLLIVDDEKQNRLLLTCMSGSLSPSRRTISRRVVSSAVAVNAINGICGIR